MNLEQFAKNAGVALVPCDPIFGGKIAYTEADCPNCKVAGFRTNTEAYNHWLISTFGLKTSGAIKKLLKATQK